MADGQGFEPWLPFGKHAFQACALDHSATHPCRSGLMTAPSFSLVAPVSAARGTGSSHARCHGACPGSDCGVSGPGKMPDAILLAVSRHPELETGIAYFS